MIRLAISFAMMAFGILLACGAAVFSPDSAAFLSSEAPGGQYFLSRIASLSAEPFVLYYGQGAWLWAVFFFGGGIRLIMGIEPKLFFLRFFAAHAAAFFLGLTAGLLTGSLNYQTAGVGGVLLSRALSSVLPLNLWAPFSLALFFITLCYSSSLPFRLLKSVQRRLTHPQLQPAEGVMEDAEEHLVDNPQLKESFSEDGFLARRSLPNDGSLPAFLHPVEVGAEPEDFSYHKERTLFYEKMKENILELDEGAETPFRYRIEPENLDEGEGELVFKIPAEESSPMEQESLSRMRPLPRLSFDLPSSEAPKQEPIDPLGARRQSPETAEILEADDTRYVPLPDQPAPLPINPIRTYTIDDGVPIIPSSPEVLDEKEAPQEEGQTEVLVQGEQDAVDAASLILPEDYEKAPILPKYQENTEEPPYSESEEISALEIEEPEENSQSSHEKWEEPLILNEEISEENIQSMHTNTEESLIPEMDELAADSVLLAPDEESLVHALDKRGKEKTEAEQTFKEKMRRRHEELASLYFKAEEKDEERIEPYIPEDIESYLEKEISVLKAGHQSYIEPEPIQGEESEPVNDEFFIPLPEEDIVPEPSQSFLEPSSPKEEFISEENNIDLFPETESMLPLDREDSADLPLPIESSDPVIEGSYAFDADSSQELSMFSSQPNPIENWEPLEAPSPKYSQEEVDNIVQVNDRIHLDALLEEAADRSLAYGKDEVPFSVIRSVLPDTLEEQPYASEGKSLQEEAASSEASAPDLGLEPPAYEEQEGQVFPELEDDFFNSLNTSSDEETLVHEEESSEDGDHFDFLQMLQESHETEESPLPDLKTTSSEEESKISYNLSDLMSIAVLSPVEEAVPPAQKYETEIDPEPEFSDLPPPLEEPLPSAQEYETKIYQEPKLPVLPSSSEEPVPPVLESAEQSLQAPQEEWPLEENPWNQKLVPAPAEPPVSYVFDEPKILEGSLGPEEAAMMPRIIREDVPPKNTPINIPPLEPVFPSADELTPNNEVIDIAREDAEIDEMVQTIEQAFESFNISMKVVDFARGPAITRFEMEPPPGLKLRTIRNLQDDIALQLGTSNIRFISPVEGRSYIGIEVPNNLRRTFLLKEFIEDKSFQDSKAELPLILGTDIGTNKICGDLTTLPHLLVAGTTGSGKSVYINALISGLLFKLSPRDLKFIMIDPKMVELELYNGIPHLLAPIITKPEEAMAALEWAVQEMDRRYKLLSDNGVRNIKEYTAQAKESLIGEEAWEHLPYIVIIVDEFANLMLRSPKDTERNISRLAAMARAVGIHLVIATQRPSVDVVTGIIKANFPCRIAFRVSSKTDSRTILDRNGAEALLGKGDMLYISPEYNEAERMQSPFVPGRDVEAIVNASKRNGPPNYVIDFEEIIAGNTAEETEADGSMTDALSDPMFAEVLRYAVESGEVSASGIQRRFRVGYNRASRLIETLKDQRIISPPPSAGKGWQVLITKDQVAQYLE